MPDPEVEQAEVEQASVLPAGLRAALTALPLLSAVVAVAVAGRTWRQVGTVAVTGDQLTSDLARGLGLLSLAAWALLLVVGGTGRRVVGVLEALIGAGLVAVVATSDSLPTGLQDRGVTEAALASAPLHSAGWLALAAAILLVLGGATLAVLARRWPPRGSRFTRSRTEPENPRETRDIWAAMDRGEDPTVDPDGEPPAN
ncbi:Trp biosynthesis-associated membrane protein [Acidipropionibacterium virtanenii]|uniref:Tryptophan-associated transmembrane protein n=1 Tax=Acidipropionibacterium virtanenii TaxID=2057246 RepID=A0A344UU03_9ACTN|nr:Trp biosynthesis-associated membrane protein [Acidipropionibacterium virtanenii]AXE38751.1 hypothetical protein JS278_01587 [Acidipropionibacterium virtanenii]